MDTSILLEQRLKELCAAGLLVIRTENNRYLKISYKGTGKPISEKWNVKIYTSGAVVCPDPSVLNDVVSGNIRTPDASKITLQCDDSGWGFPLLGIMVGVTDGEVVETDTVDVSFFQGETYAKKLYLAGYAEKGLAIITERFHASPKTHRIEICSGYVNTGLRDTLRRLGYDVRIADIKGLLQNRLENLFKEYVKNILKCDLAYDPKEMRKQGGNVGQAYYRVLEWGKKNAPHLLKTGWGSIGNI